MRTRKLVAILLAAALCVLPTLALAIEIDLADGSLTIGKDTYTHGSTSAGYNPDTDTFHVTQSNSQTPTSNTITVQDGAAANITLDDVNIKTDGASGIDLQGDAEATLTLVGENTVENTSGDNAAVHVAGGDLTITGESGSSLTATASGDGAGIGTKGAELPQDAENLTGSITIKDDAKVTAWAKNGAGIGSGWTAGMDGSISIGGNATVTATSDDDGAGIGGGDEGSLGGSIIIDGNATVTATAMGEGAGIGAGEDYNMAEGSSITIGGNATVIAISAENGAGIGTGNYGEMEQNSSITIKDNATVTATAKGDGAGIGTGIGEGTGQYSDGKMEQGSSITISGNARVTAVTSGTGANIGTGKDGDMDPGSSITIEDRATVTTKVSGTPNDKVIGTAIGAGGWSDTYHKLQPTEMNGSISLKDSATINLHIDGTGNLAHIGNTPQRASEWGESGDPANVTIGENVTINDPNSIVIPEPVLPVWTLENQDGSIAVEAQSYTTATLHSEPLDESDEEYQTLCGADDGVIHADRLWFENGAPTGQFRVIFRLGEAYAHKTIEIRHLVDGEVQTETVTADAGGNVDVTTYTLGCFALIEQ